MTLGEIMNNSLATRKSTIAHIFFLMVDFFHKSLAPLEMSCESSQEIGISCGMLFRPCCPPDWDKLYLGQLPRCKMPNFSWSYLCRNHPQGRGSLGPLSLIHLTSVLTAKWWRTSALISPHAGWGGAADMVSHGPDPSLMMWEKIRDSDK